MPKEGSEQEEAWAEEFDYELSCAGCGNFVETAERCPCGVCPACCEGDICGKSLDGESDCGHCDSRGDPESLDS